MASLYIANCSKQPHEFLYRMPAEGPAERSRVRSVRIEAGTQQMLVADAAPVVLEAIVEQHRQYGLVPVTEVTNARTFVGLCYSFDKPVDLNRLEFAVEHNQGVLLERGEQQREAAAITVARTLEDQIGEPMRAVETQLLEDSDTPKLGRGIRVVKDEALRKSGGRRQGRGA